MAAKQAGRSLAATSAPGLTHLGRLFYILDKHSNTRFLVDTGAEVSVVPPTRMERTHPQPGFTLQGIDGTQITTVHAHSTLVFGEPSDGFSPLLMSSKPS